MGVGDIPDHKLVIVRSLNLDLLEFCFLMVVYQLVKKNCKYLCSNWFYATELIMMTHKSFLHSQWIKANFLWLLKPEVWKAFFIPLVITASWVNAHGLHLLAIFHFLQKVAPLPFLSHSDITPREASSVLLDSGTHSWPHSTLWCIWERQVYAGQCFLLQFDTTLKHSWFRSDLTPLARRQPIINISSNIFWTMHLEMLFNIYRNSISETFFNTA